MQYLELDHAEIKNKKLVLVYYLRTFTCHPSGTRRTWLEATLLGWACCAPVLVTESPGCGRTLGPSNILVRGMVLLITGLGRIQFLNLEGQS